MRRILPLLLPTALCALLGGLGTSCGPGEPPQGEEAGVAAGEAAPVVEGDGAAAGEGISLATGRSPRSGAVPSQPSLGLVVGAVYDPAAERIYLVGDGRYGAARNIGDTLDREHA